MNMFIQKGMILLLTALSFILLGDNKSGTPAERPLPTPKQEVASSTLIGSNNFRL